MASSDLEKLAEAQREAVRALAVLTEQLRSGPSLLPAAPPESQPQEAPAAVEGGGPQTELQVSASARTVLPSAGTGLERALESTSGAVNALAEATTANTQATTGLSRGLGELPALLAGLAGGLKDGGSVLGTVLQSGFGLASLGLKIAGLFGGGQQAAPQPLSRFQGPPTLALEVANTDNVLAGFPRADRGQSGEARVTENQRAIQWQPQITVNVNAMDSRSFLDHSGEIARAVREAMLYMHPVNDLISEL